MTKTTHRFGKRGSGRRTSWFPCGPQEAYCSAAFSFSGGLSSCRSLEHTQKPRRKPSDGDQRPVFFLFFFFKALWGPPMPGPWTLRKRERERETLYCEDKKSKMQRRRQNRERRRRRRRRKRRRVVWFMQECNVFSFLISRRAYYLPQDRQTCSSKAYSGNDQCCRSLLNHSSSEVPENSHSY